MYIENINTIKSLKKFIVENGYEYSVHGDYKIDLSQLELYLYDYKIPVSDVNYGPVTNTLNIYYQEVAATKHVITMPDDSRVLSPSGDAWNFDYIPTTSVEAILFVEFAKQMGLDAFKIDNYNVYWHEEGKVLFIGDGMVEYYVYGAYNDEKTGIIEFYDFYPDGGGGAD